MTFVYFFNIFKEKVAKSLNFFCFCGIISV
nr:MAG TPA: hypothetical protein [Caudoviricetes sp.]